MKYRKKPVVVEVYQYRKPLYELDVFNKYGLRFKPEENHETD